MRWNRKKDQTMDYEKKKKANILFMKATDLWRDEPKKFSNFKSFLEYSIGHITCIYKKYELGFKDYENKLLNRGDVIKTSRGEIIYVSDLNELIDLNMKDEAQSQFERFAIRTVNEYSPDGYDYEGFDKEGYNVHGRDRQGYDKEGFDCREYDRQGYDKEGFDLEGYDHMGYNKEHFDSEGNFR